MELHDLLSLTKKKNEKILIVLGDGIDPVYELHNRRVIRIDDAIHRYKGRLKSIDSENWVYYEHVRNLTRDILPFTSYFFIFFLARLGLLSAVVTTNYDMTLNTMLSRLSRELSVPVVFNPILGLGEDDAASYCSHAPSSSDVVRVWKIHGSLGHVICRKCKTLFPCPDFVFPFDAEGILARFAHPISHVYIPERPCCRRLFSARRISESRCGHYVHTIDWNLPGFIDQPPFKQILSGGLDEFNKNPFGIIILGFKGYLRRDRKGWYEEINLAAEALDGKNVHWAMYISKTQADKMKIALKEEAEAHSHLSRIVRRNGGVFMEAEPEPLAKGLMEGLCTSKLMTERQCIELIENVIEPAYIRRGIIGRS